MHRPEGLGLGLMEAMALGKPVIATAWSGNMSFMSHTNSCLVGYELIPARSDLQVYSKRYLGKDAYWADPSIEQAAAWMQELTRNASHREAIGDVHRTPWLAIRRLPRKGRSWTNWLRSMKTERSSPHRGNAQALQSYGRQRQKSIPAGRANFRPACRNSGINTSHGDSTENHPNNCHRRP
jgi:hypothetical protein